MLTCRSSRCANLAIFATSHWRPEELDGTHDTPALKILTTRACSAAVITAFYAPSLITLDHEQYSEASDHAFALFGMVLSPL